MNYLDWIAKWSSYTPHKKAVVSLDTKQSYTYKQLHENALKIESHLINKYQLKKGDRLAVLAEHSPEYLMLFIATQRLGVILVPLNYRCTAFELAHCLHDVTPSLVLVDNVRFRKLSSAVKEQVDYFCASTHTLFTNAEKITLQEYTDPPKIDVDQPVFIFYTSGTTGKPKGVIYTNRMMFWNSLNTSVQLEITSVDHTINALPPYHTSGWNVLLLPMLHRGARVDFVRRFRPKKILQFIEEEPISLFLAVPTMLRMMLRSPTFKSFKPKKLKYLIVGGEPLSTVIIDAWAKKGILIRQGYGLTEAGPSITSLHHHDALWKKGSIGKANFYIDLKIVDENNEEVAANEAGELCLRGNVVTPGYWNNSVYTLEKIQEEWFYTGDIIKKDEDGFMYVIGRKNQIYISGGENIHPSEIEKILYTYPGMLEAAVIGIEDKKWGETGIAFVSLNEGETSEAMLKAHLSKFLAPYKIPRAVIFLESLPKSGIGKINRRELIENYKNNYDGKKNIV